MVELTNNALMGKVEQFEDLRIWRDAVKIGVEVYNMTKAGPIASDYAGKDQIRRSAVSISNNIAEGFEYNNTREFIRFLKYAKGSAGELRSNLLILKEAHQIDSEAYEALRQRLMKLSKSIWSFIQYLRNYEEQKCHE